MKLANKKEKEIEEASLLKIFLNIGIGMSFSMVRFLIENSDAFRYKLLETLSLMANKGY